MTSSIRNYRSSVPVKFLNVSGGITSSEDEFNIDDVESLPPVPFTMVIEPDVDGKEEIITVISIDGIQLTVQRGEDGTTAVPHNDGVELRHMITGRDLQESRDHIDSNFSVHGIPDTSVLSTKAYADNAATTASNTVSVNAANALSSHEADTTSIHGITDTSKLATIVSASVGRKLSVQAVAPTSPAVGDIWFQVTGL
jgi:hypothetical protein